MVDVIVSPASTTRTVLWTGATGFVGRATVAALERARWRVRCATRDAAGAAARWSMRSPTRQLARRHLC